MGNPIFSLIFFVGYLVLVIAYLLTLQNTLKAVSPANRKTEPGMVWLSLIPGFNFVWNFILAKKIAFSLEQEFTDLGEKMDGRPLYNLGVFSSVMYIVTIVAKYIPMGGVFLVIAGLIVWIMYWKKIAEYKKALKAIKNIQ